MVAPLVAAAGLEAAASLGAGAMSAFGQHQANKQNVALTREQMAFQERMSNTAYSRAVQDLRAAGLNPLLAVGAQASSPGGSQARVEDVLGKSAAAALEARRFFKDLQQTDSQIDLNSATKAYYDSLREKTDKDADKVQADTNKTREETKVVEQQVARGFANPINAIGSGIQKLWHGAKAVNKRYTDAVNESFRKHKES
jgi:hypothetical protein